MRARLLQLILMVITNLEEKENRKIWVPIRGGNRGGWTLFDWEKVRDQQYVHRQQYLGNSVKIGVLDKGGKWRKKDWYLHKNNLDSGETLSQSMQETIKRDQQRMNVALGLVNSDEENDKLTPAEMQLLMKKIKGGKDEMVKEDTTEAAGLGFDKGKVQIRAKASANMINPHRLEGTVQEQQVKYAPKSKKNDRSRSRSQVKKKHKKQKHSKREHRQRSESEQRHRKKHRHRSRSRDQKQKKHKERKHRERSESK